MATLSVFPKPGRLKLYLDRLGPQKIIRETEEDRRELLVSQAWRALRDGLTELPSYKHTAFVALALTELIEDDEDLGHLRRVVDAIDRARLKIGDWPGKDPR